MFIQSDSLAFVAVARKGFLAGLLKVCRATVETTLVSLFRYKYESDVISVKCATGVSGRICGVDKIGLV